MASQLLALIPAYCPGPDLVGLVSGLARESIFDGVMVIDDGSGPHCATIFRDIEVTTPARVVRHSANLGKGAALKTGLAHALATTPRLMGVVTADADGQHRLADIRRVGEVFRATPGKLALGVRDFVGDVPLRCRIGNLATRHVFRWVTGQLLSDTQTGLRGIPASLIRALLTLPSNRYEFETAMLLAATALGIPFLEQPIATLYASANGSSHFDPLLDSFRIYACLARHAMGRLGFEEHAEASGEVIP